MKFSPNLMRKSQVLNTMRRPGTRVYKRHTLVQEWRTLHTREDNNLVVGWVDFVKQSRIHYKLANLSLGLPLIYQGRNI